MRETLVNYRPIGLSIVTLVGRDENMLLIAGANMLDGTPLPDIKPYSAKFYF